MAIIEFPDSISMKQVNQALDKIATALIALNDTIVRALLGKPSGTISLADAYGKIYSDKLSTPVVTVTTTESSMTFTWEAVAGARYWYYLDNATTATEVSTNSYKISDLSPGASKTLKVYYTKIGFPTSDVSVPVTGTIIAIVFTDLVVNATAISGTLVDAIGTNYYKFIASYATTYTITLAKTSTSSLNGYLSLYDNAGILLATDDYSDKTIEISKVLKADTTYKVTVTSLNGSSSGDYTIKVVRSAFKLATPVFTVSKGYEHSVSFTWNPVPGATSYEVTFNYGTFTQTGTSFTSAGSLTGTYGISVVAKSDFDTSSEAGTSSAATTAIPPGTVYVTVDKNSTSATITATSTNATLFKLIRYTDDTGTVIKSSTELQSSGTFKVTEDPNTTYYFGIQSYSKSGDSTFSGVLKFVFVDDITSASLEITENTTGDSVKLTLKSTYATSFYLYQVVSTGYSYLQVNTTGIFTVTGLYPDTTYSFIGYGVNAGSNSPWSNVVSPKTPNINTEKITLTFSDTTDVKFTVSMSYTGPKLIYGYLLKLYKEGDTINPLQIISSPSTTFTGLKPSTKYYVLAAIYDSYQHIGFSTAVTDNSTYTKAPTQAPGIVSISVVSYQTDTTTIQLAAPASGGGATTYYLYSVTNLLYAGLTFYASNDTGIFTVPKSKFWTGFAGNSVGYSSNYSYILIT